MSNQATTTTRPGIPGAVRDAVKAVRERRRKAQLARAFLWAATGFLAALTAAVVIDWVLPLHHGMWRFFLLCTTLAAAGTAGFWSYSRGVLSQDRRRSARLIDDEVPELEERFSTVTGLAESTLPDDLLGSPELVLQVGHESERLASDVRPAAIVRPMPWRRVMACAALPVAGAIALALWDAPALGLHTARVLAPWGNFSLTKIELGETPGTAVRGEPFAITAEVRGRIPREAVVEVRNGSGEDRLAVALDRSTAPSLKHTINAEGDRLRFRVLAGDGKTAWREMPVHARPKLTFSSSVLTPPTYTGLPPVSYEGVPRDLVAVQGSVLTLVAGADQPDTEIVVTVKPAGEDTELSSVSGVSQGEQSAFKIPLLESLTARLVARNTHGLEHTPVSACAVAVFEDKPPLVELTEESDRSLFSPADTLLVEFEATDDFGVHAAEIVLTVQRNGQPAEKIHIPVDLAGQSGEKQVRASVPVDLSELALDAESTLSYSVNVADARLASGEDQSDSPAADPNDMALRKLDLAQAECASCTSQPVDFEIYSGEFEGEPREKTELELRPFIKKLKGQLASADRETSEIEKLVGARYLQDGLTMAGRASEELEAASGTIDALVEKSEGTPYGFIGLQLRDIEFQNLKPAAESIEVLGTAEEVPFPAGAVRSTRFQLAQALAKLERLETGFESVAQAMVATDLANRVKKMYRVYAEGMQILAGGKEGALHGVEGKVREVDDAYIAKLKEHLAVLKELMADLEKQLEINPVLRAQYLAAQQDYAHNLRDQLTFLTEDQEDVATWFNNWSDGAPPEEGFQKRLTTLRQGVAQDAVQFLEKSRVWLPLFVSRSTGAGHQYLTELTEVTEEIAEAAGNPEKYDGRVLLGKMVALEGKIPAPGEEYGTRTELVSYAVKRRAEMAALIRQQRSLNAREKAFRDGKFYKLSGLEQRLVTSETDNYTAKLTAQLAGVSGLSPLAAERCAVLEKLLTDDVPGTQTEIGERLDSGNQEGAKLSFLLTSSHFRKANEAFDELLKEVAAQTEACLCLPGCGEPKEADEKLGNILHRLNVDLLTDWESESQKPGSRPSPEQRAAEAKKAAALMAQAARLQEAANAVAKEAADAEAESYGRDRDLAAAPAPPPSFWNTLPSALEEDLAQSREAPRPPRYRRAIESYFETVSRISGEEE